ncbi:MAG: L-rhamnose isomerase, partial [Spirochaetota bacterium]
MKKESIAKAYETAKETYGDFGINVEQALARLNTISLSIHCWQGDDVGGFEKPAAGLSGGGIQVTGNYPGKARTIHELEMDLEKMFSCIPGNHRLSLHAIYGDFGKHAIERDEIGPEHFNGWIEWARHKGIAIDFNCTCFSHPKAEAGFTLSSKDRSVREFWIRHVKRCREISAYIGEKLKSPCIHNIWIPDGSKDITVDRRGYREVLKQSLDSVFETKYDPDFMKDALESKLFGIGSESFVVGSHEFYLGYVLTRGKMVCLDLGHFHPTESIADKLSSILLFSDELLLHVSRSVRWDSDHVVIFNDDVRYL